MSMKFSLMASWMILALMVPGKASSSPDSTYEKLDVFAQVLQYIQNGYVDEVKNPELLHGAIRGMLKELDPHSVFMSPEEFKSMQEDTSGAFGGVGLEMERRDDELIVVAPIDDTPAHRAGILSGDRIVKIDGQAIDKMDVGAASRLIKGTPGTKVVLTIDRVEFEQPKDFVLIRQRIRLNPIDKSMPMPGYGLIRIKVFTERTERYLKEALVELRKKAGGKIKGLVLDLRNNPGGLLEQAVRVGDLFIADGVLVETRGRARKTEKENAHKRGTEPAYPMVCLVNGGSASASEIVAGALQDHNRSLIMGVRTFGKGSVQTIIGLKDGSGLKLTIARYYTPNHRSIQEKGIAPDVVVPKTVPSGDSEIRITREVDLEGHLRNESKADASRRKLEAISDYQLRTALVYLRAWERFGRGAKEAKTKP